MENDYGIMHNCNQKGEPKDDTSKTKQKTNIQGELFFEIPLQTKGEFFCTDGVRKDAFFILKTTGKKNELNQRRSAGKTGRSRIPPSGKPLDEFWQWKMEPYL